VVKLSALSKTILGLRKAQRMTQGDLAKKVGVSTNSISQFEKGGIRPSLETLAKLSEALGEDLRLLLPRDGAVPVRSTEENIEVAIIRGTQYARIQSLLLSKNENELGRLDPARPIREKEATNALTGAYDNYAALTLPPSMLTAPTSLHRAFPMPGNGMAPTFEEGDLLVMRQLDPSEWHTIDADRRNHDVIDAFPVYAVYSGNAYGKSVDFCRVGFNKAKQSIRLHYDNRMLSPRSVPVAQVTAIWKFEWLLSRRSPNLKNKISDLEYQLAEALTKIKELEAQLNPSKA
jgi:transcriptional regulator with XRE-family HTH domain